MTEDRELLEKQLEVNNKRIKKLEMHKKTVEVELRNLKSTIDHERVKETMKRLEHNLQFEYNQHKEIIKRINLK